MPPRWPPRSPPGWRPRRARPGSRPGSPPPGRAGAPVAQRRVRVRPPGQVVAGVLGRRPGGQVHSGLAAGLIAPVPDHRQAAGHRIRARHPPAEHVAIDVRRYDQAARPVRGRPPGARPEPPVAARGQCAEKVRALPGAAPVHLAVIPGAGILVGRQRLPQVTGDPAELVPLPRRAGRRSPARPRWPGKDGHTFTVRSLSDSPGIASARRAPAWARQGLTQVACRARYTFPPMTARIASSPNPFRTSQPQMFVKFSVGFSSPST